MQLVDSHAHLHATYFDPAAVRGALVAARAAGVVAIVNVATELDDSVEVARLAAREPDVWATAGVHPHETAGFATDGDGIVARIRSLAGAPRVVAIGECGLDYHYDHAPREVQRDAFRRQVRLARELDLPLVIHNRESDDDLVAILADEGGGAVRGVVHAFSTTPRIARRCLELGLHLGFGGMITFKSADLVRSSLRETPLDRLLLETDAPYLTPVPHRGRPNEPMHVRLVAERAAAELEVDLDQLAAATTANALRLFRIALPWSPSPA